MNPTRDEVIDTVANAWGILQRALFSGVLRPREEHVLAVLLNQLHEFEKGMCNK